MFAYFRKKTVISGALWSHTTPGHVLDPMNPTTYRRVMELKNVRTELAVRITKRRKQLDLTQEQLARLAGVKVRALADIERGETKDPRTDTLHRIANVLQVSIDYLLNRPRFPIRRPSRPKVDGRDSFTELYGRTA